MEKRKSIWLAAIALILFAALSMIYYLYGPKAISGSKTIEVTVEHSDKEKNVFVYKTDAEYLSDVLLQEELISCSESGYGMTVDTVDGEKADMTQNQWWILYFNGEYGKNTVDKQPIADGDKYEFKIEEY